MLLLLSNMPDLRIATVTMQDGNSTGQQPSLQGIEKLKLKVIRLLE
jgi:hypothetical protein